MPHEGLADCSTSHCIPGLNSAVVGSGDDALPIGRVSNTLHPATVPLEGVADCTTSHRIPDSNGAVNGSGGDVLPIGRVSNTLYFTSIP